MTSAYPLDHLDPGSVVEDFLLEGELTAPGGLQTLGAGYGTHLSCHGYVVFKPRQSLRDKAGHVKFNH